MGSEDPALAPVALIEELFAGPLADLDLGEPVAAGVHMRQCARLAEAAAAPPCLVIAALLHDVAYLVVGDFMERYEAEHAFFGATWIGRWFPSSVSEPVRLHVEAKRFLVGTDPSYASSLSLESARTLELQGGAMTSEEARGFWATEHAAAAVALRRFDDRAKRPGAPAPPAWHYRDLLRELLEHHEGS